MSASKTVRHPAVELLARYGAIWRAAWRVRGELAGSQRMADEAAFLPAALSLQETPPHPAPRRAVGLICLLFVVAVLWSIFGHVDIVAIAPGRIIVSERTKTLQPLEASVVTRVLVKDGDRVRAGQMLVELDATNVRAERAGVEEQLAAVVSHERRAAALLEALHRATHEIGESTPRFPADGQRLDAQDAAEITQLRAEWQDIVTKLAKLTAEHGRRRAELETVDQTIARLEATLPMARQREADLMKLASSGFVSNHIGQDRTRERVEQERDLAIQEARRKEVDAGLIESLNTQSAYLAEVRRNLGERRAEAVLERQRLLQERIKSEQRVRLTRLTAPVAGTVQQVAVHTVGGVVTPAQVLMIIVPKDAQIMAEVVIDNKDIGFVAAGQAAEVKFETFPYTYYGTIESKVLGISADAVNDEQRGAVFPARLSLGRSDIGADGVRVPISPGMNVTAEIKTGRRRIVDFFWQPVRKLASESIRER